MGNYTYFCFANHLHPFALQPITCPLLLASSWVYVLRKDTARSFSSSCCNEDDKEIAFESNVNNSLKLFHNVSVNF